MEHERKIFATFLALNASRATPTVEPTVHMMFSADNLNGKLVTLTRDDVLQECGKGGYLNKDSELVCWLLSQLSTYDCTRQRILALRFNESIVLSEVLRCP